MDRKAISALLAGCEADQMLAFISQKRLLGNVVEVKDREVLDLF